MTPDELNLLVSVTAMVASGAAAIFSGLEWHARRKSEEPGLRAEWFRAETEARITVFIVNTRPAPLPEWRIESVTAGPGFEVDYSPDGSIDNFRGATVFPRIDLPADGVLRRDLRVRVRGPEGRTARPGALRLRVGLLRRDGERRDVRLKLYPR